MSALASSRSFASPPSICRSCRLRLLRQKQHSPLAQPIRHRHAITKETPVWLTNSADQRSNDSVQSLPRWAAAPQAMRAPYKLNPKSDVDEFPVNEDPAKLKAAYTRVLGNEEAAESLPENLRWLAVTHKSFDHGRRGFNDRLAFLGKRLVEMQASFALIEVPVPDARLEALEKPDTYGRQPFIHKNMRNVNNVRRKDALLNRERMAQLAEKYNLSEVIRWKPRQIKQLKDSGMESILAGTLHAIVGAVALQRGGEVARQMVRKRILQPLGIV